MAKPSYDKKQLVAGVPFANGLDFEIHDDFALTKVRTKNNGPVAIIRTERMAKDTTELVHIIRSVYMGVRHEKVQGFTLTKGEVSFTRRHDTVSQAEVAAFAGLGLILPSTDMVAQLREDVKEAGCDLDGYGRKEDSNVQVVEWNSGADDATSLREDVVTRSKDIFSRLRRASQ